MSRYRIRVGRRIYQETTIVVTDESNKKAQTAAIAKAKHSDVAWETTDNEHTVYFIEDSVVEEK